MTRAPKQPLQTEPGQPQRRARVASVGMDAGQLGRAAFDRAGFPEPGLVLRWREIAGDEVARIAVPVRLSQNPGGGVLTLRSDPAAALFLQHESRALCSRINAYLGQGAVVRLKFVPGEIAAERVRVSRTYPQEPAPGDPARSFAGPERLKNALLALARARHAK